MCDRALFHLKHACETSERFGLPEFIAQGAISLAEIWYYLGDWVQAHTFCQNALAALGASDVLSHSARPQYILFSLCLAQGDMQQAHSYLGEAITLSERSRNLSIFRAAQAALAERDLLNDQAQAVFERLAPLLSPPVEPGEQAVVVPDMVALLPLLAWAHAELGDSDQAERVMLDAITRATSLELHIVLADALRIRGLLALRRETWDEAERALGAAISLSRAMPYAYAEAKALYVAGLLHQARGDLGQARNSFEQSLATLNQLGERLYAEQVERALAELPEA